MKKSKGNEEANLAQDADDFDFDHVLLMSTIEDNEDGCKNGDSACDNMCNECKNDDSACDKCCKVEHVSLADETNHAEDESCWYLETGCSNHMTEKKDLLLDLDPSIKSSVQFVDDSVIMAEGAERIMTKQKDGQSAYMNNVLYVPNMIAEFGATSRKRLYNDDALETHRRIR